MTKRIIALLSCIILVLCLAACDNEKETPESATSAEASALWEAALYKENTELGEGAKTVTVDVVCDGKTVSFTIHTDAATLGEALLAHKLVEGDQGDYGLYIKKVNGIQADYDKDKHYWGFYKNGEMMMTGVDGTQIANGEHYELKREK